MENVQVSMSIEGILNGYSALVQVVNENALLKERIQEYANMYKELSAEVESLKEEIESLKEEKANGKSRK